MAKKLDVSLDAIIDDIKDFWEKVVDYFKGLDLYSLIAWGAIGLGLILLILAIIFW